MASVLRAWTDRRPPRKPSWPVGHWCHRSRPSVPGGSHRLDHLEILSAPLGLRRLISLSVTTAAGHPMWHFFAPTVVVP